MITDEINKTFFLGIGGIGMSGLAKYLYSKGIAVAGYDKTKTVLTSEMEKMGIKIHYKDNPELIDDLFKSKEKNLVVYTPAIPKDNNEFNYFIKNNFKLIKRSVLLGKITENSFTISVAGTHGKTTTSSLITHILKTAGIDCTAFLGGITVNYGSNYIKGKENIMVVEADEYDRSFLTLHSDIAVVTSMDPDHLDIYGSFAEMKQAYLDFTRKLKSGGKLIVRNDLELQSTYRYFLSGNNTKSSSNPTLYTGKLENTGKGIMKEEFSVQTPTGKLDHLVLGIPGKHNVENAVAAVSVAQLLKIPVKKLKKGLSTFNGVKRRFEMIINRPTLLFIDDYAHHPQEIFSCLDSLKRKIKKRNVTVIFQPHLFSRTRDFAREFGVSLSLADQVVLLEIYPAREKPVPGVTSEMIYKYIESPQKTVIKKAEVMNWIKKNKNKLDVLVTMGAGDIDQLVKPIKKLLENE